MMMDTQKNTRHMTMSLFLSHSVVINSAPDEASWLAAAARGKAGKMAVDTIQAGSLRRIAIGGLLESGLGLVLVTLSH